MTVIRKARTSSTKDQQNSSDGQNHHKAMATILQTMDPTMDRRSRGNPILKKPMTLSRQNDSPSGKETPNKSETSTTDSNDKKPTNGDSDKKENGTAVPTHLRIRREKLAIKRIVQDRIRHQHRATRFLEMVPLQILNHQMKWILNTPKKLMTSFWIT